MDWYGAVIRPLLFLLEGEEAHRLGMWAASWCDRRAVGAVVGSRFGYAHPSLAVDVAGIPFAAPLGIAAGFDKEGCAIGFAQSIGASHLEVGTVTMRPQPGNDGPRVFRIPEEGAIVNRMGFPSSGVDALLERIRFWIDKERSIRIGINIGKNKDTPLTAAVAEYAKLGRLVAPYADYVCLNISSPNTPDLRMLQEPQRLSDLLAACREGVRGKPLFVKLSPDLELHELAPIVAVLVEQRIDAIVATNTTLSRASCPAAQKYEGGLSGVPLFERSVNFVRHLYREVGAEIPLVGVGGINSAERALAMIAAGATALQAYTGIVFRGPAMVSQIHRALVAWMEERSISSIHSLVGNPELLVQAVPGDS